MYIYILNIKGLKNLINKIFYHIILVIILSIIYKLIFIILRIIFYIFNSPNTKNYNLNLINRKNMFILNLIFYLNL